MKIFMKKINDKVDYIQLCPNGFGKVYKDSIEEYGYFEKKYKKLSEEIQNALDENDFLNGGRPTSEPVAVRYSKRIHGEAMLAEIEPLKEL